MRKNLYLLKKIGTERGVRSEGMVEDVLKKMKDDGEIISFYKTGRRKDEIEKIDFVIIGLEREKISFQVKSSFSGAIRHWKKFPDIPVVIVNVRGDLKAVKEKITELINNEGSKSEKETSKRR